MSPIPYIVDHKVLNIDWNYTYKVNEDDTPITYPIHNTQHELYVTYANPLSYAYTNGKLYESCVWLGCEAAKGKSTEQDVFNAIWNKFQTMNVRTKDGRQLGYYKAGAQTGGIYTTAELLQNSDGRCGAWADLFKDVMGSQGITVGKYSFKLKDHFYDFGNAELGYFRYNAYGNIEQVQLLQNFTLFQNEGHPQYVPFIDHVINTYYNNNEIKYYDVTGKYNYGDFSLEYYVNYNLKVRYTLVNTDYFYDEIININDIE